MRATLLAPWVRAATFLLLIGGWSVSTAAQDTCSKRGELDTI
jgi:hypothetical protein